jgi:hypothetical protein
MANIFTGVKDERNEGWVRRDVDSSLIIIRPPFVFQLPLAF